MKHVAVFGYSTMSVAVMTRLRDCHYQQIFIGQDEQQTSLMRAQGFISQVIDFKNDDELKEIGVGTYIDTIFCFFPNDSDNVFLTISARALDSGLTIIAIIDDPESADKLLAAGADKIIDPHEICGRKAHDMLTRSEISTILDNTVFGQHDLNMAEVEIPPASGFENRLVCTLNLSENHNMILLGVVKSELSGELFLAIGEQAYSLAVGDVLVVLGATADIQAFKDEVGRIN